MSGAAVLAACAMLLAGAAPLAEALRSPVAQAARSRAAARGHGRAIAGRDGIIWRRRRLGPADGPVALLVHGLTTPSPAYDAVADRLAAAGWQAISYDLYGRGLSERLRGPYDSALYLRQIEDVLAAEGVDGPVLAVGYSMGGVIVTALADALPARVSGLCLLAPGGMGHTPDRLSSFARDVPGLGDWAMTLLGPASLRGVARAAAATPSDVPGISDVMAAETHTRGYMRAVLSSLRHMLNGSQCAQHQAIASRGTPTLAIWGRDDTVIPLRAADALHAANPEATRIEVAGAGHGLPFTHAQAVADAILDRFGPPGAG
jgi:pimeloyl-ACP methyl ester carboxylesterase